MLLCSLDSLLSLSHFPFYPWAHPGSVVGPEWPLPPFLALLCSRSILPCLSVPREDAARHCWQSLAHEQHRDAQAVVPVTSAAPPSFLPFLAARVCAGLGLAASMGIVGTTGRDNGAGSILTPRLAGTCSHTLLQRGSVFLLPHTISGCSGDLEQPQQSSWCSVGVSSCTPLSLKSSTDKGCRVSPSPSQPCTFPSADGTHGRS